MSRPPRVNGVAGLGYSGTGRFGEKYSGSPGPGGNGRSLGSGRRGSRFVTERIGAGPRRSHTIATGRTIPLASPLAPMTRITSHLIGPMCEPRFGV